MRKISVSCTLTVFHDGRFWVGVVQRIEDGRLFASRIVFGAEPSNEEIEQLVLSRAWDRLCFPDLYDAASRMCEAAAGVASYGRAAEGCCAPVSSARDAGTGGFLASGAARIEVPSPPKNPKRCQRNVRKQMKRDAFARFSERSGQRRPSPCSLRPQEGRCRRSLRPAPGETQAQA